MKIVDKNHNVVAEYDRTRLNSLRAYAIEELNAHIDESEEQIARGEVFSYEEVMAEMRNIIASM